MALILDAHGLRAEFKGGSVKPDQITTDHHILLQNGEVTSIDFEAWSSRPEGMSGTLLISEGEDQSPVTFSFSDAFIQSWTGAELTESVGTPIDHVAIKAARFGIVFSQ